MDEVRDPSKPMPHLLDGQARSLCRQADPIRCPSLVKNSDLPKCRGAQVELDRGSQGRLNHRADSEHAEEDHLLEDAAPA